MAANDMRNLRFFGIWFYGVYWIEVFGRSVDDAMKRICGDSRVEGIVLDLDRPMFHV